MTDGESNLRLLPVAEPDDDPVITKQEPADRYCRHQQASIDENAHRLYCRDCKEEIDPLDFLLDLAGRWASVQTDRDSMKAKARLASRELIDVQRRLKNAKARLRKEGVLLTTAEAHLAREQLRAMARVTLDAVGDQAKAIARARLLGFKQEDAQRALKALDAGLEAVGRGRY